MNRNQIFLKTVMACFLVSVIAGCRPNVDENKNNENSHMNTLETNVPGSTNFSLIDRMAITDVLVAFSTYWDSRQLEKFIALFTDTAVLIWSQADGTNTEIPLEKIKATAMDKFQEYDSLNVQQRHLSCNHHFISQSENSAVAEQYVLLANIENKQSFKTQFTMVYRFWLRKEEGVWRIEKYMLSPDMNMEVPSKK